MNRIAPILVVLVAIAACGSDDPAGPSGAAMSARIDGVAWASDQGAQSLRQSGVISLAGTGSGNITLAFAWFDEGTGTYTIGTDVGVNANLTVGATGGWLATTTLGSGSIVVTNVTDSRVAGTFSFTLEPVSSTGATGTRTITNGSFDVAF